MIESHVAVVSACLPTFRALFIRSTSRDAHLDTTYDKHRAPRDDRSGIPMSGHLKTTITLDQQDGSSIRKDKFKRTSEERRNIVLRTDIRQEESDASVDDVL